MNDTKIASKAKAQLSNAVCHPRPGCQPFLKGKDEASYRGKECTMYTTLPENASCAIPTISHSTRTARNAMFQFP